MYCYLNTSLFVKKNMNYFFSTSFKYNFLIYSTLI